MKSSDSVMEFLAGIPMLQRLPISTLKRIADVVFPVRFGAGEYVVLKGEGAGGLCFIKEGEIILLRQSDTEKGLERHLKANDCFGSCSCTFSHSAIERQVEHQGALLSDQRVDVLALSELTCLVLPREHCKLLQSKSIWMFDGRDEASSLMERILHLVPIEVNLFRGITLPGAPRGRQIFGGQLIGQALAAASKTFGCLKFAHHVQAYFLRGGDYKVPTIFKVFQVHDGKDITTRRVEAIQEGKLAFLLVASFLKEADGLEHQEAVMPTVPSPDMLLSIEDVMEKSSLEYHLSSDENKKKRLDPFPIDIRVCNPDILTRLSRPPPRLSYWFKSREKLSDDPALHQCVVAYASDLIFIQVSTNPHQRGDYVIRTLSLNHTMWFHRTTRADEWILHVIDSPLAYDARGICTSQMFNTKGELVASLVQEGLLRRDNTINTDTSIRAKF